MNLFTADHFLIFRVDSKWLGMPAAAVREVLPRPEITIVPTCSPMLIGMSHLRNEFLAIVDLGVVPSGDPVSRPQLLVVLGDSGPWGWLVNEVSSLASLEVSRGSCTDASLPFRSIITGTATLQGKSVMVVDSGKALRFAENAIGEKWEEVITV